MQTGSGTGRVEGTENSKRRRPRTFVDLPEGPPPQQLAQLQAAQQRLLALAQHSRQVLHRAGVAVVGPACTGALQTPKHHPAMQ